MALDPKLRRMIGNILTGLLLLLYLATSMGKILGAAPLREAFETFGLSDMRVIIGLGELVAAIHFAIPRTSSIGALLLSAVMGGAITAHMSHEENYAFPAFVLVLVWIALLLRNPGFFGPPRNAG